MASVATHRRLAEDAVREHRRLTNLSKAAEYADVHPMTIRRWIAAGRLPGYRVGPRLLKVDLNDLDAMLTPVPTGGSHA